LTPPQQYCTINPKFAFFGDGLQRMTTFELTSSLGALLISLAIQTIFVAGPLWCAMKIMRKKGTFASLIIASIIAALLGFIPYVGPLIGLVVLIILIARFTSVGKLGAALMVVIAWVLGIAATIGLLKLLDALSIQF